MIPAFVGEIGTTRHPGAGIVLSFSSLITSALRSHTGSSSIFDIIPMNPFAGDFSLPYNLSGIYFLHRHGDTISSLARQKRLR